MVRFEHVSIAIQVDEAELRGRLIGEQDLLKLVDNET